MPTYQYKCEKCGHELEIFQRMSDLSLTICPNCDSASLERVISVGGGFVLKGNGFYNTDYKNAPAPAKPIAQSSTTDAAKPAPVSTKDTVSASPQTNDSATSSKPSEVKTETKPTPKTEKST